MLQITIKLQSAFEAGHGQITALILRVSWTNICYLLSAGTAGESLYDLVSTSDTSTAGTIPLTVSSDRNGKCVQESTEEGDKNHVIKKGFEVSFRKCNLSYTLQNGQNSGSWKKWGNRLWNGGFKRHISLEVLVTWQP